MLINVSKIKQQAHARGKRAGRNFLLRLDAYVQDAVERALSVHNGSKITLDDAVADYVLGPCHHTTTSTNGGRRKRGANAHH